MDSGGGFSITFTMPSYQTAAVQSYLTNPAANLPSSSLYNAAGRAYPDISAIFGLYIPYCMVESGKYVGVAGTSAASPIVSGVMSNLNNIQLKSGKVALGFLNPWLYQVYAEHPNAFQDPRQGVHNGGAGAGFTSIAGWDPCTGVGTPNQAVMALYLP